jgi:hypothetical protein
MTHKCINCGWPGLTWSEARQQYGRMIGHGLKPEIVKKLSPRCRKCTSIILRGNGTESSGSSEGSEIQTPLFETYRL